MRYLKWVSVLTIFAMLFAMLPATVAEDVDIPIELEEMIDEGIETELENVALELEGLKGDLLEYEAGKQTETSLAFNAVDDFVIDEEGVLTRYRGIDRNVVHACTSVGLIYESAKYHNVVFVGKDEDGVPRHAHKRSTTPGKVWRANEHGSDNRFTFNLRGSSDRLFLFEAPIDMLSYITLYCPNWQDDSFLAACSVSDSSLNQFLEGRPDISQVFICFDNDPPGQKAAEQIKQRLSEKGINCEILVPTLKDWNEDLLNSVQEEGEVLCQTKPQFL